MQLKEIIHSFSYIFYPEVCVGCGALRDTDKHLVCSDCYRTLDNLKITQQGLQGLYAKLSGQASFSQSVFALYTFEKGSPLQGILHSLKYQNNKSVGVMLGNRLGEVILSSENAPKIDAIIPVPIHHKKVSQRKYNQSDLIARGIAEVTHIPLLRNLMIRKTNTESQTRKHRNERLKNVEDVFYLLDESKVQGKHILLLDDVITTGSTICNCAKTFSEKARGISFACVASAQG